jgi:hypothetical protein
VLYIEYYTEHIFHEKDTGFAGWMNCVTVNIIWKLVHSRRLYLFQLEWNMLQWILYWRYFGAGGHWYCRLNELCYSEYCMEVSSQQEVILIAPWMKYVTVDIIREIIRSKRTLLLQFERSVVQLILSLRYFAAGRNL